ncbi:hypothetical protein LCGC14_3021720, partial [marine sediment metagenome]
DVFGNKIEVGDFVIYAASLDRSAILKVGVVLELRHQPVTSDSYMGQEKNKVSVRTVERVSIYKKRTYDEFEWKLQKNGSPLTLEFTERMVRVAPKTIPSKVRALLKRRKRSEHTSAAT